MAKYEIRGEVGFEFKPPRLSLLPRQHCLADGYGSEIQRLTAAKCCSVAPAAFRSLLRSTFSCNDSEPQSLLNLCDWELPTPWSPIARCARTPYLVLCGCEVEGGGSEYRMGEVRTRLARVR